MDVAEAAGVTQMTVSRAFSGSAPVAEATRLRIMRIAEELGYRPNRLASGLRGGATQSIGVVWGLLDPWASDAGIGNAILDDLQRRAYATYHCKGSNDPAELVPVLRDLADRSVDAVVVQANASTLADRGVQRELQNLGAVVAVCERDVPRFSGDVVVHERGPAIVEVVDHLVATGRRRPRFLGNFSLPENAEKLRVFAGRCREHGLGDQPYAIELRAAEVTPDQRIAGNDRRHLAALEAAFPGGVDADALFVFNDLGALICLRFVEARGRRVPEDVAVIGFNNDPLSAHTRPALATGDRHREAVVEACTELLTDRLGRPDREPRRRTVPMTFLWRASAGGPGPAAAPRP